MRLQKNGSVAKINESGVKTTFGPISLEEQSQLILENNRLMSLGIDNSWKCNKNYSRYRKKTKITNDVIEEPMTLLENIRAERNNNATTLKSLGESPLRKEYIGSLDQLGNKHISSFIKNKARARETIMKEGVGALNSGYLYSNLKNAPFQQRPTSISVFPYIGQISNKNVYTTQKNVNE